MTTIKEIEIRSEEVQDILSFVPHWLTQWGSTLFSVLVALLIFLSWIIQYPEIISGRISLTTQQAPVEIVNQVNGTLKMLITDQEEVNSGDRLAIIANPSEFESIEYLSVFLTRIDSLIQNPIKLTIPHQTNYVFGEIQGDYNLLLQQLYEYRLFHADRFYNQKLGMLKDQIMSYDQLIDILEKQIGFQQKELINVRERYNIQQTLFQSKMIPKLDYLEEENTYFRKEKEVEELRKAFIELKITKVATEGQINELIYEYETKDRGFRSSISKYILSINNYLSNWRDKHILVAPFDGKISFISNWKESEYVKAGEELFTIIPLDNNFMVNMLVPSHGFGKIRKNNKVLLKLDDYPYQEYGQILGTVTSLSLIPHEKTTYDPQQSVSKSENQYRVKISLNDGSQTSFKKAIKLKPYMSGTAEIITENRSVLDRIIKNFY